MKKHLVWAAVAAALVAGPSYFTASPHGQSQATIVMAELNNPRGLAFGPEGALYVVEAGRGGAECAIVAGTNLCAGHTGALTRLWRGRQERVVTGLPSRVSPTTEVVGPHDVSFLGRGSAFITIGWGGEPHDRDLFVETKGFGSLLHVASLARSIHFDENDGFAWGLFNRFESRTPPWRVVADVSAHEVVENPAGGPVDSNPFGVLAQAGGALVADAGANALLRVTPSGEITTVATFPSRPVRSTDAVPTEAVVGPDGAYYVSELTGAPFSAGAAAVYRLVPGAAPEVFRDGFKTIIDIDFGSDGSLYVLEHATGAAFFSGAGRIVRVRPDGSRNTVLNGIDRPTSVLVDDDDTVYVTNFGVSIGTGEVWRVEQ